MHFGHGGHFEHMMWTGWSHLIWHNFIKVAGNWTKFCSLSFRGLLFSDSPCRGPQWSNRGPQTTYNSGAPTFTLYTHKLHIYWTWLHISLINPHWAKDSINTHTAHSYAVSGQACWYSLLLSLKSTSFSAGHFYHRLKTALFDLVQYLDGTPHLSANPGFTVE